MAHRLPRPLYAVAALVLLLAGVSAQPPGQPTPSADKPKPPEPAAKGKELSAEEIDAMIEKAFGRNCPELKRPVRLWIAHFGLAVAAEKADLSHDRASVRLATVSIASRNGSGEFDVIHGTGATIAFVDAVATLKRLDRCEIASIEVKSGKSVLVLTPQVLPITETVRETADKKKPDGTLAPETTLVDVTKMERRGFQVRFLIGVDPNAVSTDLLPPAPKFLAKVTSWTNENLAKVPEMAFGEPMPTGLSKLKAMEAIAHTMAKINHVNGKKRDGFMLAMLENRSDLRGLPFLMGDECRTREDQAKAFNLCATQLSALRSDTFQKNIQKVATPDLLHSSIMQSMPVLDSEFATGAPRGHMHRGMVAAGGQILMPESGFMRAGWAKTLATIPHIDATKALASLAIFSPEDEVRAAAIEGLKLRRENDYTDILVQGFRYPLPAVSKRAADAIVKLERKDLLGNLIEVLESPDPRLPATREGKTTVRELVRVNHHRNCLLCHAPGNTPDVPEGVLKVAVPLPGEPLPKPSEGGYQSTPPPSPDIVVRLDMTYLRQDFSLMMPVADAHPWPEMQRFDFLVRTREITPAEAKAYVEDKEPDRLSPYHRSALYALRELTGRDTEPTAAAWRKLLKL